VWVIADFGLRIADCLRPPATGQTAPTKVRAKRDESEAVEIFRFMTIFCLTSVSWCGRLILLPQKELRPK